MRIGNQGNGVLTPFMKAAILLLLFCNAPVRAQLPNVIVIMADDLGWGDVEYTQDRAPGDPYAGHPVLQTPNLSAMAESGITFNRFYSASPVCSPTRASLLTGRYGRRHGIDGPLFIGDTGKIRNRDLTIAELAKMQGYTTGHFGKWHVGSLTKDVYDMRRGREGNYRDYSAPWNNGYDVSFASENWMPTYDPYDFFPFNNAEQAAYFTGPSDPALTNRVPNDSRVDNRDESVIVTDQALDFIDQSQTAGKPFMTTIWFATPHVPLVETPDTSYDGMGLSTSQRRYFEAVTKMDEQVGRIRQKLADLGIADNTLLVFTSDNGPDNLSVGSNGGLSGKKGDLAEGGIRVPAVMEWPGKIADGTSTDALATTSDFVPTLLDLWGGSMPDDRPMDGSSFKKVLLDGDQQRSNDYRFYSRYQSERMAMDNRYKLLSANAGSTFQLYDLTNDPTEQSNLLSGSPDPAILQKRDELLVGLNDWLVSADISRAGGDYDTRLSGSSSNVVVQDDIELSLTLSQIGTDTFGAPVYEDKYQIVEGNSNFEDTNSASVFIERQYATLNAPLAVDTTGEAGTYDSNNLPVGAVIPAGEVIHSYLVHFDPDITSGEQSIQIDLAFEDDILGVIGRSDRLDASDFLAFAEPRFDLGNDPFSTGRGMLFGESSDGGWTIDPGGKSITVDMLAGFADFDQLRIITQAVQSSLFWSGDNTGLWTTDTGTDWDRDKDNVGDSAFASNSHVVFGDGASTFNVSIVNPVSPASVNFRNTAGNDYTLTGAPITGTGGLTFKGGGIVTLSNDANSYLGATNVESGTLALAGSTTISSSPIIHVESGGTLDVTGTSSGSYTLINQKLTIDGDVHGNIIASGTSNVIVNSVNSLNGNLTLQSGSEAQGLGRITGNVIAESGSVLRIGSTGNIGGNVPMAPVTNSESFQGFGTGTVFANNTLTGSPSMPGWHFVDDAGSGEVTFVLASESGDVVLKQTDISFPEINRGARAIFPLQSDGQIDTITVQMRSDETDGIADRVVYFAYEDDNNFSYAIVRLNGTASFGDVENGIRTANIPANTDFGSFPAAFTEFVLTHDALTGQVALKVDGITLYDLIDERFADGATGAVGIGTGNDAASFDDLIVTTETPSIGALSELTIDGNYTQLVGAVLALELYDTLTFESLNIGGNLDAGGTLDVSFLAGAPTPQLGDAFDILDFTTASGAFDAFNLPILPSGLAWSVANLLSTGELQVMTDVDFDNDGDVDGADFLSIQRTDPSLISAWVAQFGNQSLVGTSTSAGNNVVPEPSSLLLLFIGLCCRAGRSLTAR